MGIKVYRPRSPGLRQRTGSDFSEITKNTPEHSLAEPLRRKAARNNTGQITVRHQGGGHKRRFRVIDFSRIKTFDIPATVVSIEYDPNRTARIALLNYVDGAKSYIVAPVGLNVGDTVLASASADIKPGNALPWLRFRQEQLFIISKCVPVRERSWLEGQASAQLSSRNLANIARFGCLAVKFVRSCRLVWLQLAKLATLTTRTLA